MLKVTRLLRISRNCAGDHVQHQIFSVYAIGEDRCVQQSLEANFLITSLRFYPLLAIRGISRLLFLLILPHHVTGPRSVSTVKERTQRKSVLHPETHIQLQHLMENASEDPVRGPPGLKSRRSNSKLFPPL